jgi:hypothetical protein
VRYGFRVHKIELGRGLNGRRRLELRTGTNDYEREQVKRGHLEEPPKVDYLNWLQEQCEAMRDAPDSLTDIPRLIRVADGADEFVPSDDPGTPRLVVTDVTVSGRRLDVEVEYGHLGWHHRAVGATKDTVSDLTDQSPMQRYRVTMLIPDRGTAGLAAAETISGGHALDMLNAWLNLRAWKEWGDDEMLRLMTPKLTDMERVLELLDNPNALAEVQLARTKNATIDGVPSSGKITLREEVVPGTKVDALKKLLGEWNRNAFKYDAQGKLLEVKALAEVIAPGAGEIGFDDGYIQLQADGGKKVTVRPTKLGDLYAYPISDVRPSDYTWTEAVKTRLLAIAAGDDLPVVW